MGLLSVKKGLVSEYVLPSKSCRSILEKEFEIFRPSCSIPLDVSNEGTFISRPSGDFHYEELNLIFKKRRFTMLLGYPYENMDCIKCFNKMGTY